MRVQFSLQPLSLLLSGVLSSVALTIAFAFPAHGSLTTTEPSPLIAQARVYLEQGYPERAIETLEEAIREGDMQSKTALLLAEIYYDRFQLYEANQALMRALRLATDEESREQLQAMSDNWRARYGVLSLRPLNPEESVQVRGQLNRRGRLINQHKQSVLTRAKEQLEGGYTVPALIWLPHGQYELQFDGEERAQTFSLSAEASSASITLSGEQHSLNIPPSTQEGDGNQKLLYWGLGGAAVALTIGLLLLQPDEAQQPATYQLSFD